MKRTYGRLAFETSNEDKPLFPGEGPTKKQVIEYYERISGIMLPHLRDRPLVMRRCPDGIEDGCFYQREIGEHFPAWIDRVAVETAKKGAGRQTLVVAQKRATLAYLASQAVMPMHTWLSRRDALDRPDRMLIDLDPPSEDFRPVRRAALRCRQLLEELGLTPFVKTTGSRGLHVVVVLNRTGSFDGVRRFAGDLASLLSSRHPEDLTTETRKGRRRGRLYLDTSRNAYGQTAIAPYSLRALPGAPVAAPLEWSELSDGGLDARRWTMDNIFRRLGQRDDPWERMGAQGASLEEPGRRLEAMLQEQEAS